MLQILDILAMVFKSDKKTVYAYLLTMVESQIKNIGFCGSSIQVSRAEVTVHFNNLINLFEWVPLCFAISSNSEPQS